MTPERWYRRALGAYPSAYRQAHGEVLLGSLLDADNQTRREVLADSADLVVHGLQHRLGLTAAGAAGTSLARAAGPGLAMAGAFSLVAFWLGHEIPNRTTTWAHMGPFATIGAALDILWALVMLGVTVRPTWQRRLAAVGIVVTAVAFPVGQAFFATPPTAVMLLPAALAVPAVLAPAEARPSPGWATLASALLVAVLVVVAGTGVGSTYGPRGPYWLYQWGMVQLQVVVAISGVFGLLLCTWLAGRKTWERVATIAVASMPWLVAGAVGNRVAAYVNTQAALIDWALAIGAGAVWLTLWLKGLRQKRRLELAPA